MQVKLPYGKRELIVDVEWSERKRFSITVKPDLTIIAKAPVGCDTESIHRRLRKRAAWIARQVNYFKQFQPLQPERKYISGETHYYLGRQYRLRIRKEQKSSVKLKGRFFEIKLPDPSDRKKAKELMLGWYSSHAKNLLDNRLRKHLPYFLKLGASEPEIRFRRMKKRWGSCKDNGVIMLNTELVKAPLYCIDYVIVHELCHLIFPHHEGKFYRLLKRLLPDWEKRKERLERVVI
ncbi:MAG: M48 family metallopeptidase [Candidatus Eremiobacteraeota bacterium]|nr:M48 family metallopeptidase [Candidatus Eremiobacteraeota bacterium]